MKLNMFRHPVFALAIGLRFVAGPAWAQGVPEVPGLEQAQREALGRLESEQRAYLESRDPASPATRLELQRRLDQQRREQQYLQRRQLGESMARERLRNSAPPVIGLPPSGPRLQEYRRQRDLLDLQLRLQRRSWRYDWAGD